MRARVLAACMAALGMSLAGSAYAGDKTELIRFDNTPFPYRGKIPEQDKPFLDVVDGDRRGHTSARAGVYWEDTTYSDKRVLLTIPSGFDPTRPALIIVFLHGNGALLERDVRDRQQVPQQLSRSGLNAVLVAPQFASDAYDSSAGRFWEPGMLSNFLNETAHRAAKLQRDPRLRAVLLKAPVVIVAYSGGYQAAAFSAAKGGADHRIAGIILFDSLYGQEEKFADWLARHRNDAFFFSTYTEPARASNETLQRLLRERAVSYKAQLPAYLRAGSISFLPLHPDAVHSDVLTIAWAEHPFAAMLERIPGFSRWQKASSRSRGAE